MITALSLTLSAIVVTVAATLLLALAIYLRVAIELMQLLAMRLTRLSPPPTHTRPHRPTPRWAEL